MSRLKIRREQIIDTAMSLLDRDGLEGVTLRTVAAELHVHAGVLYWHVRNKQDLLDEMTNVLLSEHFRYAQSSLSKTESRIFLNLYLLSSLLQAIPQRNLP